MNRNEKQIIVDSLKESFKNSQASFIVGVKGLTVEAVQGLRKGLYTKGGTLKVAKNTLLKRATDDMQGLSDLAPYFKEQVAIVFANKETPDIAKLLFNIAKENERFTIVAGSLNYKMISKEQIERLALLPAREVLLAQVCGTLNAPIASYIRILNQLILRLLWVLKQAAEKQQ